jgi:phosphatidylinositol alpha-1,6-mannosyltransferase
MPSRLDEHGGGEGFGIVYLEAGARGLPVVAGNVGGATDAVVHGETGLLIDPTDPDAVAGAIVALLTDKDRARSMGEAGRRWAERHACPTITAQWEDLLLEVIDAHRTS